MPGRRPRWKRGDKFADERCGSCGGRDFVDAVDNHGKSYRGCSRCTLAIPPDVLTKLEEEGNLPRSVIVTLQDGARRP